MKIRIAKQPLSLKSTSKQIEILSEENCLYSVNLTLLDGAYVPSFVFEDDDSFPDLPENMTGAYYSEANGAVYFYTSSAAYRLDSGAFIKLKSSLEGKPVFVDMYISGFPSTVFMDGTDRVVYTGYAQESAQGDYSFRAGAVHCGRFFGADSLDGARLRWAASHPLDWQTGIYGSGYINLPPEGGDILRLFSYGDRLVAVRERGITVIRAYGDPQNYKVDATANYLTADGIIADTCAPCDGKIYFCTKSGLFAFGGTDTEKLLDFGGGRISAPAFAAASGSDYFLSCTDKYAGDCLLCYRGGDVCVCAVNPSALFAGKDGVYAVCGLRVGKIVRGGLGQWHSRPVRPGGLSYIRNIGVVCDGDAEITLSSAGISRTFSGGGRHAVNMGAGEFTVDVTAQGALRSIKVEAEV